jgi:hypothetical protein
MLEEMGKSQQQQQEKVIAKAAVERSQQDVMDQVRAQERPETKRNQYIRNNKVK